MTQTCSKDGWYEKGGHAPIMAKYTGKYLYTITWSKNGFVFRGKRLYDVTVAKYTKSGMHYDRLFTFPSKKPRDEMIKKIRKEPSKYLRDAFTCKYKRSKVYQRFFETYKNSYLQHCKQ